MRGRTTEYRMLHYWVENQLGKPNFCVSCGLAEGQKFEWANISGNYLKEIDDWQRLCVPCHRRKDNQMDKHTCKYGHEMTQDNTYLKPNGKHKECRTCRALRRSNLPNNKVEEK